MATSSKKMTAERQDLPLSEAALVERLKLSSPELVAELFSLTKGRLEEEDKRQTRLDTKATSLLTASGVSVTVSATLGSALVTHASKLHPFMAYAVGAAFLLAVGLGLRAARIAMKALRVRSGFKTASEHAILDAEILFRANAQPQSKSNGQQPDDDPELRAYGLMEYRKYLVLHLWPIAQEHNGINSEKASDVALGQCRFIQFLGAIFLTCVLAVFGFLIK